MKVTFVGFALESKCPMDFELMIDKVIQKHSVEQDVKDHKRLYYVDKSSSKDYYTGLVLTIKNQKRFCKLTSDSGTLKISVENLKDHDKLMEFNFFVLHKTQNLGLYQHYHQSCSPNQMCHFLAKNHYEARQEIIAATSDKKVKKSHLSRLEWQTLVREDQLDDVIKQWKRVKYIQMDYTALTSSDGDFQRLKSIARRERRKIIFQPSMNPLKYLKEIVNVVTSQEVLNGTVCGIDASGKTEKLLIENTPMDYGEMDFDEFVARLDGIEPNSFSKSWAIKTMITKCNENVLGKAA